jgi:hypothetical protein
MVTPTQQKPGKLLQWALINWSLVNRTSQVPSTSTKHFGLADIGQRGLLQTENGKPQTLSSPPSMGPLTVALVYVFWMQQSVSISRNPMSKSMCAKKRGTWLGPSRAPDSPYSLHSVILRALLVEKRGPMKLRGSTKKKKRWAERRGKRDSRESQKKINTVLECSQATSVLSLS